MRCRPGPPAPAPAGPASGTEPADALIQFARRIAAEHHAAHGQPITRDALRARLSVSNQLAGYLHANPAIPVAPTAGTCSSAATATPTPKAQPKSTASPPSSASPSATTPATAGTTSHDRRLRAHRATAATLRGSSAQTQEAAVRRTLRSLARLGGTRARLPLTPGHPDGAGQPPPELEHHPRAGRSRRRTASRLQAYMRDAPARPGRPATRRPRHRRPLRHRSHDDDLRPRLT